jgi:DNA processing protein
MAERFGSLAAVFDASENDLLSVQGVGLERARLFSQELKKARIDDEMDRADRANVKLVTWVDAAYPTQLKQIADPPMVLYVAGTVETLDRPAIAIVGTRHASVYGREVARQFSYQLAASGYVVVSGLALGIDTEAHTGALQSKGRTVAVLGGALDCLFPRENSGLAREIALRGGAVVSEYPFGRQPDRQTFPMRNRIVSGLCKGVLVVEAPENSGTMITVNQALEQGRTVMAIPGRIDSPSSSGCHRLVREGARLVTTTDEVIEELQDLLPRKPEVSARGPADDDAESLPLSPEERAVWTAIEREGSHMDELVRASGLDAGRVNALVVGLQIKRQVRLAPGGFVLRNR